MILPYKYPIPLYPDVRLDFEATDIKTGNRIFVDHKGADQGKDISRFPSHETVAYRMPSQKVLNLQNLVNFDKIKNSLEKLWG